MFKEDLSADILKQVISTQDMSIEIQETPLILARINLEKLQFSHFLKTTRKIRKFTVKFLRPTYFNMKGRDFKHRFPTPDYLFANISNTWNAFAPVGCKIDKDAFLKWAINNISVSSFKLQT
ncbi:MAG: hypothetical protein ACTSSI_14430, partial [Candidatus Helarchaeota archaeon]